MQFLPSRRRALAAAVFISLASLTLAVPQFAAGEEPPAPTTPSIINGNMVDAAGFTARWQFIAALFDPAATDTLTGQFCGGSVIAPTLVLTATHCTFEYYEDPDVPLRPKQPSEIDVVTGRTKLSSTAGEVRDVVRIVRHPGWADEHHRGDVALLELAAPVSAPAIQVVAPGEDALWGAGAGKGLDPDPARGPWIAGWGNRDPYCPDGLSCNYPDDLWETTIPLAADVNCQNPARGGSPLFDARTMLCGGVLDTDGNPDPDVTNGRDTCQGDSGGPLIVSDGAGGFRLVGITSWGYACAGDTYGVYARLGTLRTWVDCQRSLGVGGAGPAPLEPPGSLVLSALKPGGVTISFSAPAAGTTPGQYNVYLAAGAPATLHSVAAGSGHVLTGLRPKTRYFLSVKSAVDGCAESASAAGVPFTTPADKLKPSRPGKPAAAGRTRTSLTVKWSASRDEFGIARYLIQERVGKRWKVIAKVGGAKRKATLRRLRPNSAHQLRVQAVDSSGNPSRPSATRTLRTRR